jgi:hypothetical protein
MTQLSLYVTNIFVNVSTHIYRESHSCGIAKSKVCTFKTQQVLPHPIPLALLLQQLPIFLFEGCEPPWPELGLAVWVGVTPQILAAR